MTQQTLQKPANSLQKRMSSGGIGAYFAADSVKKKLNEIMGGEDGSKFVSSVVSAVSVNPALSACEHGSILSAALLGHSLKLSPSPQLGQYYMVPFKCKEVINGKEEWLQKAQFILGYKGYVQLAQRSGYYKKLNALEIKKGELVKVDRLNETIEINFIEDDIERENAETTHYFAFFEYLNGFTKILVWSKKKMEAHALKYSKGYAAKKGYTFWEKDFDEMAKKTMLRQLISKWGIMSIDMQKAFEADEPEESGKQVIEADYVMDAQTTQTLSEAAAIPASRAAVVETNEDTPPNFFG